MYKEIVLPIKTQNTESLERSCEPGFQFHNPFWILCFSLNFLVYCPNLIADLDPYID